jgi:hypothetical protein
MKTRVLVVGVIVLLLILSFATLGVQQGAFPGVIDLPARVQRDLANEKKRFLPENSVDISMAMKLITHEPPRMLSPPGSQPPLLLYPPSEETLERMSGSP